MIRLADRTGDPIVTANNPIADVLGAPLGPDWTVEGLVEQLLGAIAARRSDESQQFVLDANALTDRQTRRLLRPLLACLATTSAAEAGTPANLYGDDLSFKRLGPNGPVWIIGQFENRPGSVRVTLWWSNSPPQDERYEMTMHEPPVRVPGTVPAEDDSTADQQVEIESSQLGPEALPHQ